MTARKSATRIRVKPSPAWMLKKLSSELLIPKLDSELPLLELILLRITLWTLLLLTITRMAATRAAPPAMMPRKGALSTVAMIPTTIRMSATMSSGWAPIPPLSDDEDDEDWAESHEADAAGSLPVMRLTPL